MNPGTAGGRPGENREEINAKSAERYVKNKDEINAKRREKRKNRTPEEIEACRLINEKYYAEHREEILEQKKVYGEQHKEERRAYNAQYREENKEYLNEQCREYGKAHRKEISEHERERLESDIEFRIRKNIRLRANAALKNGESKAGSFIDDMDCTIRELRGYLEQFFYPDSESGEMMTWDNYGKDGWSIDHLVPLAAFDLTDRAQFIFAAHYTNLRPMWDEENRAKSDKIEIDGKIVLGRNIRKQNISSGVLAVVVS